MLKILLEKWDKNKGKLEQELLNRGDINNIDYKGLVGLTFDAIFNNADDDCDETLDIKSITEVDDGDYQGTLLYLIHFDTYQPSESDYLMTHVGYGSCSGCDTLQSIQDWSSEKPTNAQVEDLMSLCKDIVTNTIKPYNYGWRKDDRFDEVEFE